MTAKEPAPAGASENIRISAAQLRLIIIGGLAVLAAFVVFPLFETGFTTRDNAENIYSPEDGWQKTSYDVALASGRFYHLLSMPLAFALVRLYLASPGLYHFLALGSVILNVGMFYWLVRTVFLSRSVGLLAAVLCLTWLQNNWQHALLTSYPVLPHFALTCLLLAIILLFVWARGGPQRLTIWAGIAFVCALVFSEAFAAYFPVLLAVCVYRVSMVPNTTLKERTWTTFRGALPVIVGLILYLACYFIFRLQHPSRHFGNQLAPFDLRRIVAVIWQYTASALPGYFYFRDPATINVTFDGFVPHSGGIGQLLMRCRAEWFAKALVASLFFGLIFWRRTRIISRRFFVLALMAGVVCLVSPLFFISLTRQYQGWVVESHSLAYATPSYCAYFAMVFLIVALVVATAQWLAPWRRLWMAFLVLGAGLIGATSIATDYYNFYVTRDQQLSHLKWRTVDRFLETEDFKAIGSDAVFYAPSLWQARGIAASSDNYWSVYVTVRSGKTIKVVRTPAAFDEAVSGDNGRLGYFLGFEQAPKDPDQFLIFARLQGPAPLPDGPVYVDEFALFSYGKARAFTVVGNCASGQQAIKIEVNGQRVDSTEGNVFFASIDHTQSTGEFPRGGLSREPPGGCRAAYLFLFPRETIRQGHGAGLRSRLLRLGAER